MFPEWVQTPVEALVVLGAVRFALVADPAASKRWSRMTQFGAACAGFTAAMSVIETWGWWAIPVLTVMIAVGVAWTRRLPPPSTRRPKAA